MQIVRFGQQRNCRFCQRLPSDARVLIASPDKLTYICEECTLDPAGLQNISEQSVSESNSNSAPSGVFGLFRRGQSKGTHSAGGKWGFPICIVLASKVEVKHTFVQIV